jgi:anti-sigma B factor antagonist
MKESCSSLHIEHKPASDIIEVIGLSGKLMLGPESAQLQPLIHQLMQEGRKHFVFDLSGVTHIDSTGIGRFIDAYAKIGKLGGQIRMTGATGAVRDAFRVTRLDTVFPFFPTVDDACKGLS